MLVGAVLFGALGVRASRPDATPYTASSQILVGPLAGELSVLRAAGQQAQTYADLATSRPILDAARRTARTRQNVTQLEQNTKAKADLITRLLKISVAAHEPDEAARLANQIAAQVVRQTQSQRTPVQLAPGAKPNTAQLAAGLKLEIVDFAEPGPVTASGGTSKSLVGITALAGILAAFALGLVIDVRRRRVDTLAELEAAAPVPPIGTLTGRRIDAGTAALARVRTGVLVADAGTGGAAPLALALAEDMAADGVPVVLVDADPSAVLSEHLGLSGRDVVPDPRRTEGGLRALAVEHSPGLFVVPRGALPRSIAHADAAERAAARSRAAARAGSPLSGRDAVVLCAGPAAAVPFLGALADEVDGAVLAVRKGATTSPEVSEAVTILDRHGLSVLGTVLVGGRRPARLRRRSRQDAGGPRRVPAAGAPAGDPAERQPA
jgi:capsular polysaccharide biosynthesis protein